MHPLKLRRATMAMVGMVLLGTAATAPRAAEEGTVEAFSSWQARGQMFPTGPEEATFIGSLSGILHVIGEDDSTNSGVIACPGTVVVNTDTGAQQGHGKCVIITADGERVFGEFRCTGTHLEGCNGDFTFTGGTGEKAGISGGGPIQLKSAFINMTAVPGSIVEQQSVGLARWPSLKYKIP